MKILLVEPNFPKNKKSKNHCDFLPIGLLKIGSFHKLKGDKVKLVCGLHKCGFTPDRILITSLFTYWSKYVHEAAAFYRKAYPNAKIEIGGIYASLMPEDCKKRSPFAHVSRGLYRRGVAEKVKIDYTLLPEKLEYQIVHSTRGCIRNCPFCGTWKIEPVFTSKPTIANEICSNKLVFYDNNLLANPDIENILTELSSAMHNGRVVHSESQCGIDGRLLNDKIARMLKDARFVNPRIAWDGKYNAKGSIKRQIDILKNAGFSPKNTFVFMVYNFDILFEEMIMKVNKCKEWGVQIADCRFRPLNQTYDNYSPNQKEQTGKDYYIHPKWTDTQVRAFRKIVRQQNIVIRYGFSSYKREMEIWGAQRRAERKKIMVS